MKILHLANWNSTNIGNGALIRGTERLIREDFPGPVEFVPEAWDDYTFKLKKFDESFVELVNKSADALLVNGAVTMNAFRRNTVNTGMRFDLPLPLWERIEKPIILYGISYRCWPFQEYPNKDVMKRTIEYAIANKNVFFGVRNDGTKEWIARTFGIESDQIHEVPDPGLFVPAEDNDYPELHPSKKNVIIAFNNEDAVYRFATPIERLVIRMAQKLGNPTRFVRLLGRLKLHVKNRRRIVTELARAAEKIALAHDVRFILMPHYLDDYGMLDEFINIVQERIAHQRIVSAGLLSVERTEYFYGRYKKADLAISMRVHSMSPSIGLGIPVIPLTSQGRMRNFLTKAGLADIAVDVSEEGFGAALAERAIDLLANPAPFLAKTQAAVAKMRSDAKNVNVLVHALVRN